MHPGQIDGQVGKLLTSALGQAAVGRRYRVHFERIDNLLRRLKAYRLDNTRRSGLHARLASDDTPCRFRSRTLAVWLCGGAYWERR